MAKVVQPVFYSHLPPKLLLAIAAICGGFQAGCADVPPERKGAFNIVEENDSFLNNSDKHYTQGTRLSYATGEQSSDDLKHLAKRLFIPDESNEHIRLSIFLGQSIFTPENLFLVHPDPQDRPYAGWLYAGTTLYRQTEHSLDRAELTIGVVGPAAGGGRTQNKWHELTRSFLGGAQVNGWDAQLQSEPGLIFTEERKWRTQSQLGWLEADVLPEATVALGNVFTYGALGAVARFGQGLSVDWGPPRVQPAVSGSDFVNSRVFCTRSVAWYVFAGMEGRLVARSIFLDGNSFQDSVSVRKEPFVADFNAGVALLFPHARFALTYNRRTKEFKTQANDDEFLSLTLISVY